MAHLSLNDTVSVALFNSYTADAKHAYALSMDKCDNTKDGKALNPLKRKGDMDATAAQSDKKQAVSCVAKDEKAPAPAASVDVAKKTEPLEPLCKEATVTVPHFWGVGRSRCNATLYTRKRASGLCENKCAPGAIACAAHACHYCCGTMCAGKWGHLPHCHVYRKAVTKNECYVCSLMYWPTLAGGVWAPGSDGEGYYCDAHLLFHVRRMRPQLSLSDEEDHDESVYYTCDYHEEGPVRFKVSDGHAGCKAFVPAFSKAGTFTWPAIPQATARSYSNDVLQEALASYPDDKQAVSYLLSLATTNPKTDTVST